MSHVPIVHDEDAISPHVITAAHPRPCIVHVGPDGGLCPVLATWLLCCPNCLARSPYCQGHAEQLSEALDESGVYALCVSCRRAITPTWLPL